MKKFMFLIGLLSSVITMFPLSAAWQLDPNDPIPILAYYYIWFNPESWDRAKTDYPTLGRYSSDDRSVMEQHIIWAKEAGIDGFIVSWKSTNTLNRRLEQLMDVAYEYDFHLSIIYQGLDFQRDPLSIEQIDHDFDHFVTYYADHPVFDMFSKPVVIWSGTWEFSTQDIATVTSGYRDRLFILASERKLNDYLEVAHAVDGNAYYWSSVNPETYPGYQEKLSTMGAAVHDHDGIWIAPAAPGFDARLIGGERVIERKNGETLQVQLNTAVRSSPDAIGLISWNEFSENTHIEPSVNYGRQSLEVLMNRQSIRSNVVGDFDSSSPGTTSRNDSYNLLVLGGMVLFLTVSVGVSMYVRSDRSQVVLRRFNMKADEQRKH